MLLGSVIVEYLVLREFEREISEKVELLLRDDKMTAGFLRNGIVSLTIGGTVYNILKVSCLTCVICTALLVVLPLDY